MEVSLWAKCHHLETSLNTECRGEEIVEHFQSKVQFLAGSHESQD